MNQSIQIMIQLNCQEIAEETGKTEHKFAENTPLVHIWKIAEGGCYNELKRVKEKDSVVYLPV